MKLETNHYQLETLSKLSACLYFSTLQPPDHLVCYGKGWTKTVAEECRECKDMRAKIVWYSRSVPFYGHHCWRVICDNFLLLVFSIILAAFPNKTYH